MHEHPTPRATILRDIPATVTIDGEKLLDVLAQLLRAEAALWKEHDREETSGTIAVGDAFCRLYCAAFGSLWETDEDDADETPIHRAAIERATASPLETESLFAEEPALT